MKKNVALVVFLFITASLSGNAEAKWSGAAGLRWAYVKADDGLSTRDAAGHDSSVSHTRQYQGLGKLTYSDSLTDELDFAVGMRTSGSAVSEWLNFNNNADLNPTLELGWFRYTKEGQFGKLSATAGRQKNVFAYDTVNQIIFDNDVRWDGFGWQYAYKDFGLNLAQYMLGATSQGTAGASTITHTDATDSVAETRSHFAVMYGFQPYANFKLNDEISTKLAVAYYDFGGTGAKSSSGWYANNIHGGTAGTVGNVNPVVVDNSKIWHFMNSWTLPYSLSFAAEYVMNKTIHYGTRAAPTTVKADRDAYGLTLGYGAAAVKKAWDWNASYSYISKGIASVVGSFTNGDMPADNKGHFFNGKLAVADNLALGFKVYFFKERAKLGGDGVALAAPNQNREQQTRRLELASVVSF